VQRRDAQRRDEQAADEQPADEQRVDEQPADVQPADASDLATDVRLPERPERPQERVNLLGALGATAVAVLALVAALLTELSPPHPIATIVLVAVPLLGATALPILQARACAQCDERLAWFSAGLGVSVAAATLQSLSFPGLLRGGGPLRTSQTSSILLYLLMHAALAAGAVAAASGVPARVRRWFVVAGIVVVLACALDLVPAPRLVSGGGRYTPALVVAELLVGWFIAVAAVLWVRSVGSTVAALHGWAGVALSLSVYDLLLNAISAQRYSSVWWAALALRGATYAVLAGGAVVSVLAELRRLEQYTDRELDRSDERLRGSLATTDRLLDSAERFSRAVTAADVGQVVIAAGLALTGLDRARVVVVDDESGRVDAVAAVGHDEESPPILTRPASRDADTPEAAALRTGRPVFSSPGQRPLGTYPNLGQMPGHGATQAIAVLPLTAASETVGLLALAGSRPHDFDDTQREVLGALAAQAGQALQRALLYERQLRTAELLQRGLLPQRLPAVPGIAMAARYAPGAEGMRVGGDWYDAIPVPGDRLALVVGDVMGKGVDAATRMSQLRGAVRVLAAVDPEPAAVAAGLDLMAAELAEDQIVTLVYLLLDPATGEGLIARMGHLPPVLVPAQGPPRVLDGAGSPPLGVPAARREQAPLTVEPGSVLVLFTDGLVEDRRTGLDVGLPALTAAARRLADAGLDVEDFADEVLALGTSDGGRPDDVCVLVVRRDVGGAAPVAGSRLDAAMTLPAEPASGAAARRFVERTLAGVPADGERLDTLVLLCSELVTNAVLHAAAPSEVRLRLRDGRVRLEVHDPSPQVPLPRDQDGQDGRAASGYGLALVAALADAWGVERGDGLPDVGKTVWLELGLSAPPPPG
jgi:serine phosphatase RsbU (regulator of sigma subunit)/anti-sigma regulatory factor (Ser/Thr protein kinase)